MDSQSFKALEFDQIIELLKGFATSSIGKELCGNLKPQRKLSWVRKRLGEIDDLRRAVEVYGEIPLGGIQDVRISIERARIEGVILSPEEILEILANIRVSHALKSSFKKLKGDFSFYGDLVSRLSDVRALEKEIVRTVDPKGKIYDHASPMLRQIRLDIASYRRRIKRSLEAMMRREDLQTLFQEKLITIRNDRYVVPIKSEFKGQLEGIVHDHSHSKMTIFVEPLGVVDYNNELSLLLEEERQEERRILAALTKRLGSYHQELLRDLWTLGEIDFLHAKFRLSQELRGVNPHISRNGEVRLLGARHPLLSIKEGSHTVPIDIFLNEFSKALIISGANAGGKTVALKTLGLLSLMGQSGMHIPALEGSEIRLYHSIFADIGDEQNIRERLSTFSAHILSLIRILEKADERSLVLLDELGVGTNAKEGSALAMGVMDYLMDKGVTVVVTTHLDELKAYGYCRVGVTNISVAFDSETLEPQYTLIYGNSGLSNAFLVAEKLGFPEVVLDLAKGYEDVQGRGTARIIRDIEEVQEHLRKEREKIGLLKEEIQSHRDRLRALVGGIRERRHRIMEEVQDRGRAVLQQTENELKRILLEAAREQVPGAGAAKADLKRVRKRFFFQFRPRKKKRGNAEGLKAGDWVRVLSLNRTGIISQIYGKTKRVDVQMGDKKVKVSLGDLERDESKSTEDRASAQGVKYEGFVEKEVRPEINVVGLTVEEALPVVDKFIDDALLGGLDEVDIIHGTGTGRLREAIGKHLKHHRHVKRFRPKDVMKPGVTVVEF